MDVNAKLLVTMSQNRGIQTRGGQSKELMLKTHQPAFWITEEFSVILRHKPRTGTQKSVECVLTASAKEEHTRGGWLF